MKVSFSGKIVMELNGYVVFVSVGEPGSYLIPEIPGEVALLPLPDLAENGIRLEGRLVVVSTANSGVVIQTDMPGVTIVRLLTKNEPGIRAAFASDPVVVEFWERIAEVIKYIPERGEVDHLMRLLSKVDWNKASVELLASVLKAFPEKVGELVKTLDPAMRDQVTTFLSMKMSE